MSKYIVKVCLQRFKRCSLSHLIACHVRCYKMVWLIGTSRRWRRQHFCRPNRVICLTGTIYWPRTWRQRINWHSTWKFRSSLIYERQELSISFFTDRSLRTEVLSCTCSVSISLSKVYWRRLHFTTVQFLRVQSGKASSCSFQQERPTFCKRITDAWALNLPNYRLSHRRRWTQKSSSWTSVALLAFFLQ